MVDVYEEVFVDFVEQGLEFLVHTVQMKSDTKMVRTMVARMTPRSSRIFIFCIGFDCEFRG